MIEVYDTTLRDGAQSPRISFSVSDKVSIAERLDRFGVTYIEGGWPGSNPKDSAFFAEMRSVTLRTSRLVAFGATRRPGGDARHDLGLRQLLEADTPVVALVGKAWDRQVRDVIRATEHQNLAMISDTITFLRAEGREVFFDAEHFFDGHSSNAAYAMRCLEVALEAGAVRVILCDTNGGTLPDHLEKVTRLVVAAHGPVVGIHCHDDSGVAVANTLAAVRAGAVQVQGCINGYGERSGNANLCTVVANLQLKMGYEVVSTPQLAALTELSQFVGELANVTPDTSAPYVGEGSFTHKGGQHVDAMRKAAYTYQHIEPALVGNRRRVVVSDQAGRSNILFKAREFGVDLGSEGDIVRALVERVKELEHRGYSFEGADASLELVMQRALGDEPPFTLVDFATRVEQREGHDVISDATLKVRVDGTVMHTAGEGNGPVHALDAALRKALAPHHPAVGDISLLDYKVRVIGGTAGSNASVRVLVESGDHHARWSTVGCSTNVIEASWLALADAVEYGLCLARRRAAAARPSLIAAGGA